MHRVKDIRTDMLQLFKSGTFVRDKTGKRLVEIPFAQFVADERSIFGTIDYHYIKREIEWYNSQSLGIGNFPPPIPKMWQRIASDHGYVNSNYGWAVFSQENEFQYQNCLTQLVDDYSTRRAIMIYTRPSMQGDYNENGMSDFICTNTVQYLIRNDKLYAYVSMRSNDAWSGYRNDLAWQQHVAKSLLSDLHMRCKDLVNLEMGAIIWNAGSLHLYESQFYLLDHYSKTFDWDYTFDEYKKRYGGPYIEKRGKTTD